MKSSRFLALGILGAALCAASPSAAYATESLDIAVAFKTLPLLVDKISGTTQVAVVYDAANPQSLADAQNIKHMIDEAPNAPGGAQLEATMIPVTSFAQAPVAKIVFLAEYMKGHDYVVVADAARNKGSLTVSADLGCVRANRCVLGIASQPTVEIYYSEAAATAAGVDFVDVFTMLVRRI